MCGDSTLLEPCQGVTWKVKGWVFWGQDTGTKREARWKLCFGRRKSNECMYYSSITLYDGFLFSFFFNFIFYSFNFFSATKLKFLMAGTKHRSLVQSQLRRLVMKARKHWKMKTTVLQIILKAPWPCTCSPLFFAHKLCLNKLMRCFYWPVSSKW